MARRITLEKALKNVEEYFLDLKKDIKSDKYYLVLGVPENWIIKKDDDFVAGEMEIANVEYKKVGIYIKNNQEKNIDDLFNYAHDIIKENYKIEKLKKEYEQKIKEIEESYKQKIKEQYDDIKKETKVVKEEKIEISEKSDDENKKDFLEIEKSNYYRALESDMFNEIYPSLSGEWEKDKDKWIKIREEEYKL
ncbi:MAG: hypothetical protein ACOC33_00460 [bacterium]